MNVIVKIHTIMFIPYQDVVAESSLVFSLICATVPVLLFVFVLINVLESYSFWDHGLKIHLEFKSFIGLH